MVDIRRWFSFSSQRMMTSKPAAVIEPYANQRKRGAVLLGLACDLNVKNSGGLTGAKEGPHSILDMLASMPFSSNLPLYDAGIVEEVVGESFTTMLSTQYQKLRAILQLGHFPIMLGGGHEVAIGSYKALSDTVHQATNDRTKEGLAQLPNASADRVGIINFDASFELKRSLSVKPGSAFHSIATFCQEYNREFRYLGLGICDHINSQATFAYACELKAKWLLDSQMKIKNRKHIQETIEEFLAGVDHVHLSLDLAVFPSAVAEGVNMSRIFGVSVPVVEMVLKQILSSGKVRIMDIAELNTEYDYQKQTARLAAKLIQHTLKYG
ncbi:arginase family protein [Photobacterium sp. SDRW27]|uniref:formimidoylglutamase n=1 Tax=Photobacterium obscurum TaxID=2829490 RepID=UPI002243219B|nr:formimidoylglutamase [Photobacterium obscurum]MCW8331160.1 arginase family protein [Photobacterium obscurum]